VLNREEYLRTKELAELATRAHKESRNREDYFMTLELPLNTLIGVMSGIHALFEAAQLTGRHPSAATHRQLHDLVDQVVMRLEHDGFPAHAEFLRQQQGRWPKPTA
jgi:hypothetical protein